MHRAIILLVLAASATLGGCGMDRPRPSYHNDSKPYATRDTAGKPVCSSSGGNGVGCAAVFGVSLLEDALLYK